MALDSACYAIYFHLEEKKEIQSGKIPKYAVINNFIMPGFTPSAARGGEYMKKIISVGFFITILLIFFQVTTKNEVEADWWIRPTGVPTQPSFVRNVEPTSVVHPTINPTNAPNQPTVAPTSPPTGGTPSSDGSVSSDGSGNSNNNPCAAGQSYVGPYCGWSPDVNNSGGGGGNSSSSEPRIGSPQVLGLSDTSSGNMTASDIMILAGVLCLVLYARSKIEMKNSL